ncbi:hypothetical protein HMF8227_01831 [Saliniradius amylolyticus]|uniref:SnoaL-like domain-containing protein n=1 Tax=Saliniradius amylolyticus TaxID=2183582 RepID=A0A2S2E3U3_9ALTE|nr:nuclear transport factor 2 family protein [Saliniradius amylolyticus]AWL12304.1 hypothetical protein HMF8227_01831 [Saliniradius amylolyticus]
MNLNIMIVFLSLALAPLSVLAHVESNGSHQEMSTSGLETPAGQVVLAFHQALETGDQESARATLADDVLIFEGGGVERSADEYASHHMLSDMRYMQAVDTSTLEHHVTVNGQTALSVSRSHTKGVYKGKARDYEGMETIVLEKRQGRWQIVHIHWSH